MKRKNLSILIICMLSIVSLSACGFKNEVVLKIDKEKITNEEFYNELKAEYGEKVLREIAKEKLLKQNIKFEEKDKKKAMKLLLQISGVKNDTELKNSLNLNEKQLERLATVTFLEMKLLKEKAKITEKEIKQKYESQGSDLLLNTIILNDEKTAQEIYTVARNGSNLGNASKTVLKESYIHYYFENPPTKLENLEKTLVEKVINLQEKEVSSVFEKDGQYYIVELKGYKTDSMELVEYDLVKTISEEKGIKLEDLYQEMYKKANIQIEDEELKKQIKQLF